MDKITRRSGVLYMPNHISIPYTVGDRSHSNVLQTIHHIIDSAVSIVYDGKKSIEWKEIVCNGSDLSESEIALFKDCVIGVRYSFYDSTKDKYMFLADNLINDLDLHTCFQPIRYIKGLNTSLNNPQDINMFLITGGSEYAHDFIENEYAKVIHSAIRFAIRKGLPNITIVHSENISISMEWAFKVWGYEIADKEYSTQTFSMNIYRSLFKLWGKTVADEELAKAKLNGQIIIKDDTVAGFLSGVSQNPQDYSAVIALKCCGELISDELTRLLGATGFLPRAYHNSENGHTLFESIYMNNLGTIQNESANFIPDLLTNLMLLDYIGWHEASEIITNALFEDYSYKKQDREEIERARSLSISIVKGLVFS